MAMWACKAQEHAYDLRILERTAKHESTNVKQPHHHINIVMQDRCSQLLAFLTYKNEW